MAPAESKVASEVSGPTTYSEMNQTLSSAVVTAVESSTGVAAGQASVENGDDRMTSGSAQSASAMPSQPQDSSMTTPPNTLLSTGGAAALAPSAASNSNVQTHTTPRTSLTALAPKATPIAPDHTSRNPATNSQSVKNGANTDTVRDPELPREIHTNIPLIKSSSPSSRTSPTGQGTSSKSSTGKNGTTLRRGKWTVEEEAYVARVIQDFNSGFLNASAGTTLRSYLSEKLQCDPMRITKKFTGEACIGKRVFHPAVRSSANTAAIDKAQAELDALERRWRRRLEMQQRESAKKAAASAAAASVGAGGRMIQGVPVALLSRSPHPDASSQQIGQSVVTQAASWLDRANAILKGTKMENYVSNSGTPTPSSNSNGTRESPESLPSAELENQMQEVQRLIHEGPIIQQTTAGLPNLLAGQATAHQQHLHNSQKGLATDPPSPPPEPADKRMRIGNTGSGAEDAEALVGFLRSVRASAAASNEG